MRAISLGVLLAAGLGTLVATACTSGGESDGTNSNSGGAAATGGAGTGGAGTGGAGTGGAGTGGAGTGGAGTGGAVGGDPDAVACPAATEAALLDFAPGMGGAPSTMDSTFGDFTNTFSGGTFIYGDGLTSDVTGENWHVSGDVVDYSGLGLYFANCSKVDASAFKGITFTISGDTGGKPVTLWVGTAANTAPDATKPDFGRCTAASCANGQYEIDVTSSNQTVNVLWADLTGGAPEATVDPTEIVGFGWFFTPPDGVEAPPATPYPVDLVVDTIGFIP